jgi:hypothetical protein
MPANIVKNLVNSPRLPSVFALLARIVILNLYRLELMEMPYAFSGSMCGAGIVGAFATGGGFSGRT